MTKAGSSGGYLRALVVLLLLFSGYYAVAVGPQLVLADNYTNPSFSFATFWAVSAGPGIGAIVALCVAPFLRREVLFDVVCGALSIAGLLIVMAGLVPVEVAVPLLTFLSAIFSAIVWIVGLGLVGEAFGARAMPWSLVIVRDAPVLALALIGLLGASFLPGSAIATVAFGAFALLMGAGLWLLERRPRVSDAARETAGKTTLESWLSRHWRDWLALFGAVLFADIAVGVTFPVFTAAAIRTDAPTDSFQWVSVAAEVAGLIFGAAMASVFEGRRRGGAFVAAAAFVLGLLITVLVTTFLPGPAQFSAVFLLRGAFVDATFLCTLIGLLRVAPPGARVLAAAVFGYVTTVLTPALAVPVRMLVAKFSETAPDFSPWPSLVATIAFALPAATLFWIAAELGKSEQTPLSFSPRSRIGREGYAVRFLVILVVIAAVVYSFGRPYSWTTIVAAVIYPIPLLLLLVMFARQRLHDLGRSGWSALILLIPVVNVAAAASLAVAPGMSGQNRYGPAPSETAS